MQIRVPDLAYSLEWQLTSANHSAMLSPASRHEPHMTAPLYLRAGLPVSCIPLSRIIKPQPIALYLSPGCCRAMTHIFFFPCPGSPICSKSMSCPASAAAHLKVKPERRACPSQEYQPLCIGQMTPGTCTDRSCRCLQVCPAKGVQSLLGGAVWAANADQEHADPPSRVSPIMKRRTWSWQRVSAIRS